LKVAALFAGIAGIELGLRRCGHECLLFCELDPFAQEVLRDRFPALPLHDDIVTLGSLPLGTDLVAAGFPCQDLSQAGQTKGLSGKKSSLVSHVFRLIDHKPVPWVLIENVPFMLQLGQGEAMEYLVSQLELRGYSWAYRIVDSRAFGLPQRRRRVYLLASREEAPHAVLFEDDVGAPQEPRPDGFACGFYWTEGLRGLGWAVDSVPTLKGGSTVGIPSPPAIWMPDGRIVTPSIRDAERLQGFEADWTKPAERKGKRGHRWKLVGNAVTVDAAEWIGDLLGSAASQLRAKASPLVRKRAWPNAAFGHSGGRWVVEASEWPRRDKRSSLEDFLVDEPRLLSARATAGFLGRLKQSSLRYPEGFLGALETHLRVVIALEQSVAVA